ncbi:MAG TPA: hypothetical protein VMV02_00710 [Acidimicrobiales bacterium]|nr:hypothetical protein [Acidimicrobiales bacterium]
MTTGDDLKQRKRGTISIDWVTGADPDDASTYGWEIRCEPALRDGLVDEILREIVKVY